MTRRLLWLAALLSLAAAGCRNLDLLGTSPQLFAGTWDRVESIPGNGEEWRLTVTDRQVSGTGSWQGEACCGGPLSITGYVSGRSLHVDVTRYYEYGLVSIGASTYHFDGTLAVGGRLRGAGDSPSTPNEFRKAWRVAANTP